MPALIVDGMMYGVNEVPVFLAQFYRLVAGETGEVTAVTTSPADVRKIRFSHYMQHSAFSETAFDPVDGLQNVAVPLETLHETPVESSPETFAKTPASEFPYNFIFIPDELGNLFYSKAGAYKTIFEFLDENDKAIEAITYRSECGAKHTAGSVVYGDTVRILGSVWTKRLDATSGVVNFSNTKEKVVEVYRTILLRGVPVTGQDRVKIGVNRIKPQPVDSATAFTHSGMDKFSYNFEHTFGTRELPHTGDYTVRFELEHAWGVSLGVAEIQLKLT